MPVGADDREREEVVVLAVVGTCVGGWVRGADWRGEWLGEL